MHIENIKDRRSNGAFKAALAVLIALFLSICSISYADAAPNQKYASIVIDADTGRILHQSNPDKILHPASLVKMMTLMMAFEAIEKGELRLRDRVVISNHAASMIPSKLNLPPGSTIRVEDAIYALVTKSANDVAVALGEKIKGTEPRFAAYMTSKAREIGASNTRFTNASGLHDPNQITTARDFAKISQYMIRHYPQYYHYFSTRKFTYRGQTYRNHNRLMETYDGMDGLKTGYINASGFNLAASAVRNNRRLIGVVFGGRTSVSRNDHMKKLLDEGFKELGPGKTLLVASNARHVTSTSTSAADVPLPNKKPVEYALMASANSISPASGVQADDIEQDNPKWAGVNPMMEGGAFSSMIGEGDIDPAVSKRLETGLLAISAIRDQDTAHEHSLDDGNIKPWAIQVGAFTSRVKTENALKTASANLPESLSKAVPIIVPLKTAKGWLFRARLSGYEKNEALAACRLIKDCLPVSPRAY